MYNIFEAAKRIVEKLNNPTKNYWETDTIQWNREAKAPDNSVYDEEELYESIKRSDRNRLLKFERQL